MRIFRRALSAVLVGLLLALGCLAGGCAPKRKSYTSLAEMETARVGILNDASAFSELVQREYPGMTPGSRNTASATRSPTAPCTASIPRWRRPACSS